MATQYYCENKVRQKLVAAHATINGIDYLEVLDNDAPLGSPRQRTILVYCFKSVVGLDGDNVKIAYNPNNAPVKVQWALPASQATTAAPVSPAILAAEQTYFESLPNPDNILVVRTDSEGDFSIYNFQMVKSPTDGTPPTGFDSQLSAVQFTFKVECPTEFDCEPESCPPDKAPTEPPIDYLAKDYASFRQLMLDRLSVIAPQWRERNTADLGIALVELLAYAGDHLSYYQDAVATEAYLGTARKRISARRHARLLDYYMHDGCNARTWVSLEVGSSRDGDILPGPSLSPLSPGTLFLTKSVYENTLLSYEQAEAAIKQGAVAFETLHDITLQSAHNEIHFYTWGDEKCCLPKGATKASLKNDGGGLQLAAGDVLIFEEVLNPDPEYSLAADADPSHRHAVRLTKVQSVQDNLFTPARQVMNIEWDDEDALPFPLCLWEIDSKPVSVAYGNVVMVDHGHTLDAERLPAVAKSGLYRPKLLEGPLTQQAHVRRAKEDEDGKRDWVVYDRTAPASHATNWKMRGVKPAIWIREIGPSTQAWFPVRDLLSTDRFEREFVVEIEDDTHAFLRFGGGDMPGREPASDVPLDAIYRVGNGRGGNVGADAIAHYVDFLPSLGGILKVRNPMPAVGGTEPETLKEVQLYAPHAFRTQERAVTAKDYAEVAERHEKVQKAAATLRWTGSWYTMFLTVDRLGGLPVDHEFEQKIREHLATYRMAGHDLEIDGPKFVGLEITLVVCVKPEYFNSDVKEELFSVFSKGDRPNGLRGFFHPDNFTFGDPVYLSQIIAAIMDVPGVAWVNLDDPRTCFCRLDDDSTTAKDKGYIEMGRLEIARLDNDRSAPELGQINFHMYGGL